MARIYLDARAASSASSGVGRYAEGLIPALAAQAPHHEFIVIRLASAPTGSRPSLGNVTDVQVSGGHGTAALLCSAPTLLRLFRQRGQADLYHALFHLLPFGLRGHSRVAPAHVVVTLHDCIWIDFARQVERSVLAAAWRRQVASAAIPYALRHADRVICNSESTAACAHRWVSPDRCAAIHLGLAPEFLAPPDSLAAGAGLGLKGPYIAAFGVPKAYKNIACLVRACAILRQQHAALRLVLIGGDGGVRADIERAALVGQVDVLERPTDAVVRQILRRAEALVVPSFVEGFGLPVLEAMAVGTPVIVSTAPALVEVAGGAALVFDPSSPAGLADTISRLLADPSLRDNLVRRGRLRVPHFTWSRAAAHTLAVYDQAL